MTSEGTEAAGTEAGWTTAENPRDELRHPLGVAEQAARPGSLKSRSQLGTHIGGSLPCEWQLTHEIGDTPGRDGHKEEVQGLSPGLPQPLILWGEGRGPAEEPRRGCSREEWGKHGSCREVGAGLVGEA